MSDIIDRAAMAAFAHWRSVPRLPDKQIEEAWSAYPDAVKEPWRRTARAVIEAIREPTEAMRNAASMAGYDIYFDYEADGRPSGPDNVWQVMIDEALK